MKSRALLFGILVLILGTGCTASTQTAVTPESPAVISPTTLPPVTDQPHSVEPTLAPTEPVIPTAEPVNEPDPGSQAPVQTTWIGYTGRDQNLWLVDSSSGEVRQLTSDAVPMSPELPTGTTTITYCCSEWSSDGRYLAFSQEVATPVESGLQFQYNLLVYELATGSVRTLLENQQAAGFAWKPDSSLIAFGKPTDPGYFLNRADGVDPSLAQGIWQVDALTGEVSELISPQQYSLVSPRWSASGRYLAFEQVYLMEGRGLFGYYDFETKSFFSHTEAIGGYSISPDEQQIAYDQLNYAPSGTEAISLAGMDLQSSQLVSPAVESGFAYSPLFSPDGSQLLYRIEILRGDMIPETRLMLLPLTGSEPHDLGNFDQPQYISWSADGGFLYFSVGPYDASSVIELNVTDGTTRILAEGQDPAVPGAGQ